MFPPIGWPAVAVALIFLISRIIWSRAAWWRFVVGIVVFAIVAVAGLRVLGVHESALPRTMPTVSAPAVPAATHAPRSSPAPASTSTRAASPRVYPGGGERGVRRVRRGGRAASARAARPARVRPEPPAARVRAGRRPCRWARGPSAPARASVMARASRNPAAGLGRAAAVFLAPGCPARGHRVNGGPCSTGAGARHGGEIIGASGA